MTTQDPSTYGSAPDLPPSPPGATPTADERQWAMLAHLLTLFGYLVAFGHFVPPLVVLLAKGNESAYVAEQARESLNFQITILLLALLILPLVCLVVGIPLLVLLGVAHLVFVIVASVAANDGKRYRYPWTLRLVR